jgi:3D (Asp-Asp-Asp) domain-containing protein
LKAGRKAALAALGLGLGILVHLSLIGIASIFVERVELRLFQMVTYSIEKVDKPAPLRKRYDKNLQKGWVMVMDRGRAETWRALVRHEKGESRVFKRLKRLKWGKAVQIRVGTASRSNAVRVPQTTWVRRSLKMEATAYDPGPVSYDRGYVGRTSIGERARFGIVAVDPDVVPYRSMLYVEGYGVGLAADTGGDIKGRRLDLCFNSTTEALKYGRRKTTAYLLGYLPRSERRRIRLALGDD